MDSHLDAVAAQNGSDAQGDGQDGPAVRVRGSFEWWKIDSASLADLADGQCVKPRSKRQQIPFFFFQNVFDSMREN